MRPLNVLSSNNVTRMPYPQSTALSQATGATNSTFYQALIAEKDQEISRLRNIVET